MSAEIEVLIGVSLVIIGQISTVAQKTRSVARLTKMTKMIFWMALKSNFKRISLNHKNKLLR